MKRITLAQARAMAAKYAVAGAIRTGFEIARGGTIEPQSELAWLDALTPNVKAINQALSYDIPIGDGISLPIGLSIFTGRAGSGKTTLLNKTVAPQIPTEMEAFYLRIGEPGFFIPYTLGMLLGTIEGCARETEASGKSGILLVDSLLSLWFDPAVTSRFTTGRGGASLGVPMLLQVIGQFALARGFRVAAVLHPVFADPEVIGSGISGVSSLFLNLDTRSFIVRDYIPIEDGATAADLDALNYQRKEANMQDGSDRSLDLLINTMGDES
jgi:hypothetical protein